MFIIHDYSVQLNVAQDVNQAFLTKKKISQNSTEVVSSSVSSSSNSECSLESCLQLLKRIAS